MQRLTMVTVVLFAAMGLYGCSHSGEGKTSSVPLEASSKVPAAQGTVAFTAPKGQGNGDLEVSVKHLAEPDKIAEGASTYVVWLTPKESEKPLNIGTLTPDKDLNASLKTTTVYKSFHVFITPEKTADAMSPSGKHLLSARIKQ